MTVYLLDVNVLLALTDPMHVHHEVAHRWFVVTGRAAWATCPLTENGFVRIASHPCYPNRPGDVNVVVSVLGQLCTVGDHKCWSEDLSIREVLEPGTVITHAQITDVYLLGLAVRHGGKLATLDQRLPARAVRGGAQALELIVP